jgi:hypothetical protein
MGKFHSNFDRYEMLFAIAPFCLGVRFMVWQMEFCPACHARGYRDVSFAGVSGRSRGSTYPGL